MKSEIALQKISKMWRVIFVLSSKENQANNEMINASVKKLF